MDIATAAAPYATAGASHATAGAPYAYHSTALPACRPALDDGIGTLLSQLSPLPPPQPAYSMEQSDPGHQMVRSRAAHVYVAPPAGLQ